jgi:NADP-dependent 3-hydroxy acid dehydrogenase YdfG
MKKPRMARISQQNSWKRIQFTKSIPPIVVVTGGSSDSGQAICKRLATEGWLPIIGYSRSFDHLSRQAKK